MDNFRAIPQMAEALQEMVAKGQARLATVVAAYPNEVDASLSDGSVGRFATTHNGLAVGQKGVLINAMGGAKVFTPMDIVIPQTLYARGGGSQTISTAGDYAKDGVALIFTNLDNSYLYRVDVDVDIRCWATTGTASCYPGVIIEHAGGTEPISTMLNPPSLAATRDQLTWSSAERFMPTPDGTLTVKPGIRWYSGSILMAGTSVKATIS